MALKFKVTKAEHDALPDTLKSEYTPNNDDEFELAVDGQENTGGLKSALEKERKSRAEFEKKLKLYEGLDPETAREALLTRQQAEEDKLKSQGKWDDMKAQMMKAHAKETDMLNGKLAERDGAVRKVLVEKVAQEELVKAKVKGTGKALLPIILQNSKVEYDEDTKEYSTVVVDSKGHPRLNGKGDNITMAEYVAELKLDPEYGVNFEPSGTTGGGSTQHRSSGTGAGSTTKPTVSSKDPKAMAANFDKIAKGEVTVV